MTEVDDASFMEQALALARRGRYSTPPNPCVGCVLVRDGAVIATGWHRRAGEAHAEAAALAALPPDGARGATAYVTLEPCNHRGRTPPCSDALIEAGVARVVYAAPDPNPAVAGGGAARLADAGVEVSGGLMRAASEALNPGFFHHARHGRPRVRVKLATSLDGAAALADGESRWITGEAARADVQRLRAESGAVVTGIGTVLDDDPSLNVRDPSLETAGRQPLRVVLDSRLRLPPGARLLSLSGETRVFYVRAEGDRAALEDAGAVTESLPAGDTGVDLGAAIGRLAALGVNDVLVEAGPRLAGAFLASGRVDELVVYVAPKLLGRSSRRAFDLPSPARLADALTLELLDSTRCGDDLRLTLRRKHHDERHGEA